MLFHVTKAVKILPCMFSIQEQFVARTGCVCHEDGIQIIEMWALNSKIHFHDG